MQTFVKTIPLLFIERIAAVIEIISKQWENFFATAYLGLGRCWVVIGLWVGVKSRISPIKYR